MTTVRDIYNFLQYKAPFELQLEFDNAGFLIGRWDQPVSHVLISLDITRNVVEEAMEMGADLIIAHHPVIWGGVKQMTDQTETGRILLSLAERGISAICAHTNLDAAEGGVNDALAKTLGLTDIGQLKQEGVDVHGRAYGIGRVGTVPMCSVTDFAAQVKHKLNASCVRYVDAGKPVQRVAVGGGSCGNMIDDALAAGCDTFITADVKYDQFLSAQARGLNLLDAGHYPTENVICPVLENWISQAFPQLTTKISLRHQEVYSCL